MLGQKVKLRNQKEKEKSMKEIIWKRDLGDDDSDDDDQIWTQLN